MSWFEEQLRARKAADDDNFSDALGSIAGAIMGNRLAESLENHEIASSAIDEILKFYHCKVKHEALPPKVKTVQDQLDYRMRPFGIMRRTVRLDKGWYRNCTGAMLGTLKEDGSLVALLPGSFSGYRILDIRTGLYSKVNRKTEDLLDTEAICFYRPLPLKKLGISDLLKFMFSQLSVLDIVRYLLLMLGATLLGLISPRLTKLLFSDVLDSGSTTVLIAMAVFMLCYSTSKLIYTVYQSMYSAKIRSKQNVAVQAAVMNRVISLPVPFFKKFAAGELSQRSYYVQSLCTTLFDTLGVTGLTSVFSLIYIGQVMGYAPALVMPALSITLLTVLLSLLVTFAQTRITRERMELSTKTSGMTYATITGIRKIKLAGAEKRMFARWADQYAQEAALEFNPPMLLKLSATLNLTISLIGTLVLYGTAASSGVSVSDYYAFTASYGMVSSAFMSLTTLVASIAEIKPSLDMAKPIMETEPETEADKEIIMGLNGAIELNHVSFRYNDDMPNVIDDLSLKIAPREYLAVVGSTGCGKSTLLRLLLGFERPQKGSITFDRKDISRVDLTSLRRNIGTVMQDGKLFTADIYSNIVISAPQLTVAQAWEAAELAAVADDIREMPMGMHTLISEGQGGISGGQKQRLMIARAIASKPKVLMFDEATSALDNMTQKKVTESVDALNCTRIVIAHRLSTIRHADRIIFLQGGKIVEEGTYEELIAKNGYFAELVARQRLDTDED